MYKVLFFQENELGKVEGALNEHKGAEVVYIWNTSGRLVVILKLKETKTKSDKE